MAESARRRRDVARPLVEALEGRMLLSYLGHRVPGVNLQDELARNYASPKSGEVDLTVTRSSDLASEALVFKVQTRATEDESQTSGAVGPPPYGRRTIGPIASVRTGGGQPTIVSRVIRTTGPDRSALPIVPIDGTYRFAPGQTSLTIPVRLNPNFVPAGDIRMQVATYLPQSHVFIWILPKQLTIVPSPNLIPPEVISSSKSPQAITLMFSKAMDPATVADVNNYEVDGTSVYFNNSISEQRLPLKSAVYNPATRTVTLTPTAPLTQSVHMIRSRYYPPVTDPNRPLPAGVKPLTDLQGNALPDLTTYV